MAQQTYHTAATTGTAGDPLLAAVLNYRAEVERLNAAADDDHAAEERFGAVLDKLCDRTPRCTSKEGAAAALTLARDAIEGNMSSDLHDALVAAVAKYKRRRKLDA